MFESVGSERGGPEHRVLVVRSSVVHLRDLERTALAIVADRGQRWSRAPLRGVASGSGSPGTPRRRIFVARARNERAAQAQNENAVQRSNDALPPSQQDLPF